MSEERQRNSQTLRAGLVYLLLVALSFYVLYSSRADEVYTIWSTVPSTFIIVFFTATLLLVLMTLSSLRTEFKLILIIVHGVLSLTFYALVFPFGRTGVPQMVLGEIRLIFEGITPVGLPTWPTQPAENILAQLYHWSRGYNLESLLNVVFARMFGVDVYWSNLLLIPFLWATFVPMLAYSIAKELFKNERVSILAGVFVLVFPTLIFWGTFSTHNSLGLIFFYGTVYFSLKCLSSNVSKWPILMLLFSIASFLSHFLAGIMAFSVLLFAVAFKPFRKTGQKSSAESKINLLLAMVICAGLLPLALLLHRFFFPLSTAFSLERLSGYSVTDALALFLLPEFVDSSLLAAVAFGLGSLLGLVGMIYVLRSKMKELDINSRALALFLLLVFLIILVDFRIVKLFMINVPFEDERLFAFSDLLAVPFVAFLVGYFAFKNEKTLNTSNKTASLTRLNMHSVVPYIVIALLLSGWITMSVYNAYPAYGSLQTTPYEVEAVKYIDATTNERYIVIGDPWIIFAGEMLVGVHNPRAFYFFYQDSEGAMLFIQMKNNPSNDTFLEAINNSPNNATVAFFIIEQPRLGDEEFNRIKSEAQLNGVEVYVTFGDEKLIVYRYRK